MIKITIPNNVNFAIHKLQKAGFSAYVVGGCVRDSILGRTPHDWDMCTSATPEEILKVFEDFKTITTGAEYGTITVSIQRNLVEITTYRSDGTYTDGRRPDTVSFTTNLKDDLSRRDFTINAMAYNDEEGLVDLFNGLDDIKSKILRTVGDPVERFSEDSLRILRAIRFSAILDFDMTLDVSRSIHTLKDTLYNVSAERITSEFCKIASSMHFSDVLLAYKDVVAVFIPELKECFDFQQNNPYHIYNVYEHSVNAVKSIEGEDLIVKLAALFHDIGKPETYELDVVGIGHFYGHAKISSDLTNIIMKRMRFNNEIREAVTELIFYHDAGITVEKKYIKRWLNKIGEQQIRRLISLKYADISSQNPRFKKTRLSGLVTIEENLNDILKEDQCFKIKDLAINGNDIKSIINIKEGKQIGEILNTLLSKVIDDELENTAESLSSYVVNLQST